MINLKEEFKKASHESFKKDNDTKIKGTRFTKLRLQSFIAINHNYCTINTLNISATNFG